jgi:CRP/FNR family transcriptional regulator, cyclic AMP receptor protein
MPTAGAFLERLGSADRDVMLGAGRARHYRAGETIFVVGDPSGFVVLIVQGRAKVIAPSETGTEIVLGVRGPGDLIGELGAIEDEHSPRVASVVAIDPVVCRVVRAAELRALLASHPSIAVELLRMIAARLRASDGRLIELGAAGTTRRVARLLADMAVTDSRPTPAGLVLGVGLTQDDLGGMVGASRESVARALATLRDRGLVSTGRRRVVVLDLPGLRAFGA